MATFPGIRFVATQGPAREMPAGLQFFRTGVRREAVVAGEDHQRVVGHAALFQRIEHSADHRIGLDHQVGHRTLQTALAFPGLVDRQRRVRRSERHVEQKRLGTLGRIG